MPRYPVPAAGGAAIIPYLKKSIRCIRFGCKNRPFFHIVVMDTNKDSTDRCIEQVGSYDPMPNERNERLVAFNYERIRYWMGEGVELAPTVSKLLGLSGFLPVHPSSYMEAWRRRGEEEAFKLSNVIINKREEVIMKARKYREQNAAGENEVEENEAEKDEAAQAQ